MFFYRVLYLNVFWLSRLSCSTLTRPCIPPPCHISFPIFFLATLSHDLSNMLLKSFAHPPSVALSSPPPHSSSTCLLLVQCVLEEVASRESELGKLREKAHHLWEGQAAGKGFVHRVSQLSAQYLALSNLTKVILFPSRNPTTPPPPNICMFVKCCNILKLVTVSPEHYRAPLSHHVNHSCSILLL